MEKEYTISWIEKKTSSKGTAYHKATLTEGGTEYHDVAIFKGFADEQLMNGGTVHGVLTESEFNGKKSYILNAPQTPKQAAGANFKSAQIEKAVERKEHFIEKTVDKQQSSMSMLAAQRDATLLVATFYKDRWSGDSILELELDTLIKNKVLQFRDWYISNDFTEVIPF